MSYIGRGKNILISEVKSSWGKQEKALIYYEFGVPCKTEGKGVV